MTQFDLFAAQKDAAPRVEPARVEPELRALASRLPAGVHLGTSSWAFPGWAGSVYAGRYREPVLAREGLAAYARHPLLNAVGLDRSFYVPPATAEYRQLAATVPPGFRFVVKAYAGLTMPAAQRERHGYLRHPDGADPFLDADFAARHVVAPMAEGLGDKAGALVFQFPPLPGSVLQEADRFCERLRSFLASLPRGPAYAVEVRNAALLRASCLEALAAGAASPVLTVHTTMPSPGEQRARLGDALDRSPLVVRWMLGGGRAYDEARARYAPFDRLVDPDPASRAAIAAEVVAASVAGRRSFVIANNKAEGSAPLSIALLAREIALRRDAAT